VSTSADQPRHDVHGRHADGDVVHDRDHDGVPDQTPDRKTVLARE
jgi:hypothetical protein